MPTTTLGLAQPQLPAPQALSCSTGGQYSIVTEPKAWMTFCTQREAMLLMSLRGISPRKQAHICFFLQHVKSASAGSMSTYNDLTVSRILQWPTVTHWKAQYSPPLQLASSGPMHRVSKAQNLYFGLLYAPEIHTTVTSVTSTQEAASARQHHTEKTTRYSAGTLPTGADPLPTTIV